MITTIRILIFNVVFLFFCVHSFSQTSWKGTTSTSWGNAGNWTNGVPTSSVDAIIGDASFTGSNEPNITSTATCKNLTVGGTVAVTLSVSASTTVSGSVTINSNGIITCDGNDLSLSGDWINSGTYTTTHNHATVIFTGVTQSIGGAAVTTFRKLTIDAGSTVTLNSNVTISGTQSILTVNGTINPNESPTHLITYSNLDLNANATLKVNASTFTGNYTGSTTINSGSTVNYSSTTVNQTVSNSYTYSTLTISGTGTKTLSGNLTSLRSSPSTYGNIYVTAGTFDLSTFTANRGTSTTGGTFDVSNGAILKIGGTNTFPANYNTVSLNLTSTVMYSGVNQSVTSYTYGHLTLSSSAGAATKTMPGTAFIVEGTLTSTIASGTSVSFTAASDITVNEAVSIGTSTTFNGSTFTHTINGNWTNSGTFTAATSTLILNGTAKTISGNTTFNKLTVNGSYTVSGSNIIYNGLISIATGGSFSTGSGTAIFYGDLTNNGTLTSIGATTFMGTALQTLRLVSASGTFTMGVANFNGTVAPVFTSTGNSSFTTLNINNTAGISPNMNWTASASLTVAGGARLYFGTGTHTIGGAFTNSGIVTSSGSIIFSSSGPVTLGLGTSLSSTGLLTFGGSGVTTITGTPALLTDVVISNTNAAGINTPSGWTITNDLNIDSGAAFNAGSYSYTVAGNLTCNGTLYGGTSTFTLNSATSSELTGNPSTTFYNLVISDTTIVNSDFNVSGNFTNNGIYDGSLGALTMTGSGASIIGGSSATQSLDQLIISKTANAVVTLAADIIDVSSLYINSGILFTSTFDITEVTGTGDLTIDSGATLKIGGTNSLPLFSSNSLDTNSNVDYGGTIQSIDNSVTYGNLILSDTGNKIATSSFTTLGDLIISAGTFTSGSSVTHHIGGNWIMSGGTFTNTNITINFNSSNNQTINSIGNFKHLTINKTSGQVILAANTTVDGTLTFTAGKLALNDHNLILGPSGSISGASASNYIIADSTGLLKQLITNSGTKTFPIGTSSVYFPAIIALTAASTTDTFSLRVINEVRSDGYSGTVMTKDLVSATWFITEGTNDGSDATLTFQWPLSSELIGFGRAYGRMGHYTGGLWDYGTNSIAALGSNPYTLTRAGITSFSPFGVGNMSVMPVTLINFRGENKGDQNIIYWSTASETNNDYFTVERTKDGVTYETVNVIRGAGNSRNLKKYSTIDNNPYTGTTYYRLIQTDFNGKATYSEQVPVDYNKSANFTLEIIPNPNYGSNTSIEVYTSKNEQVILSVYDYTGKEVFAKAIMAEDNNGDVNFIIPSDKLVEGVYLVSVVSGVSTQSRRLIIK